MNPSISKIENLLTSDPLIAFEHFLLHIQEDKNFNEDSFNLLLKIILLQLDLFDNSKSLSKIIFDSNLDQKQKRFIAICFLRVISVNSFFLNTGDLTEISIFKLLDETIVDIYNYPKISLSVKSSSHEKARKLNDLIFEKENELRSLKEKLKEVKDISAFKHLFLNTIGHKITKSVFSSFLPKNVTSQLETLLSDAIEYITLEGKSKINSFNKIKKRVNELLTFLKDAKNPFWNRIIRSCTISVLELIQNDFDVSPLSKPAKLKVVPFDKKYPLSIQDSEFKICLNIVNEGIGSAFNARLEIIESSGGISIPAHTEEILEINQEEIKVKLDSKVTSPSNEVLLEIQLSWQNANLEEVSTTETIILEGQNDYVDWNSLKGLDPFSQEPVTNETELIGRDVMINNLFVGVTKSKVSSYYIKGQRRVGKTSIVKTLQSKIKNSRIDNFLVIYIECGDFKHPHSDETISNLGTKICKLIKISNNKFSNIPIPNFVGAFNPITDFLDEVEVISPNDKILIILDEFDQISPELYTRTEIADSFFLTIRSISNRSNIGFILVGGEQMELVISCQGEKLNKFRSIEVDYFNRQKEWSDFQALVKAPIDGLGITIANGVIDRLYEYTSGNPYFTKMICENLFVEIVEKRDSYITTEEVDDAIENTITSITKNSFMHFWEDGIKEDSSKKEDISLKRRIVLVSFALAKKKWAEKLSIDSVVDEAMNSTPSEIEIRDCITEFVRRNIMITNDQEIKIKVKLFESWLLEKGFKSIALEYIDPSKKIYQQVIDETKRVKSTELMELVNKWQNKSYRGEAIQADKIRQWLDQFTNNTQKRVAFTLLENVVFYDDYLIRGKLKEIYQQAARTLEWHIQGTKKQHVLVSYLDKSVGKSGAEYAKLFADENKIYVDNIIEPDKLPKAIINNQIQALVFVDDIIGSGKSILENIEHLYGNKEFKDALSKNPIKVFIGVICGFQKAKEFLEDNLKKKGINIEIHICELLNEKNQCFSDASDIFGNQNEKMQAKAICYEFGVQLEPKQPLGFSDCQTLIVFPKTCPNNTLPILWKKTSNWFPLFERPSSSKH